jgi:hypothetical protein
MTEAELKDGLVKTLKKQLGNAVVLRHEDKNTAGIPDISVTYLGRTIWMEVKYAFPYTEGRGLQLLTCLRLAEHGICWFVVYKEVRGERQTLLVKPSDIIAKRLEETPDECMAAGFDHEFVADFIRSICRDYH